MKAKQMSDWKSAKRASALEEISYLVDDDKTPCVTDGGSFIAFSRAFVALVLPAT